MWSRAECTLMRISESECRFYAADCERLAKAPNISIERRGNLMKWSEQLNGDCPKRDAHELHGRCDLICPDLPKVL